MIKTAQSWQVESPQMGSHNAACFFSSLLPSPCLPPPPAFFPSLSPFSRPSSIAPPFFVLQRYRLSGERLLRESRVGTESSVLSSKCPEEQGLGQEAGNSLLVSQPDDRVPTMESLSPLHTHYPSVCNSRVVESRESQDVNPGIPLQDTGVSSNILITRSNACSLKSTEMGANNCLRSRYSNGGQVKD